MENCYDKVVLFRRLFLRYFVLSLVFLWAMSLIMWPSMDFIYHLSLKFFDITQKEFTLGVFYFISAWKLLVMQFTLLPTIALWWLEKGLKKSL